MKKIKLLVLGVLIFTFSLSFFGCSSKKENQKKSSYEINCAISGNVLSGTEKVTFYNFSENAFKDIKFNIYGNAYREDAKYKPVSEKLYHKAYPNGVNFGKMEINSVKSAEQNLEYSIAGLDQNILVVSLPSEVYPNESVTINIDFTLTLSNIISRTGINDKTINLGNFYPILCGIENNEFFECEYYSLGDPFFSDVADYRVTFSAPKDYVIASSGALKSENVKNGEKTSEFYIENARSFCMVLSKEFKVLTKKISDTEIKYYYYEDEFCEQNLEVIEKSLAFFNESFGKYPYPTYSVVQTKFIEGGMEYPALTFISDELEENQYKEVIVHETAHQWWQTVVGNNEIKEGFLDEGLTEYSVVLFYENHLEFGYTRKDLIKIAEQNYKTFCTVYNKLFNGVNTVMNRSLKEFTSEFEYVNMAYVKPCIMYDYFRTSVGDAKFFEGLKKYYKNYAYKNACVDDLIASFESVGTSANAFFKGFLEGKVII